MADFSGRSEAEQRLAKRLGKLGGDVQADILSLLGDPPDITRLTAEVWQDIETRYVGAVRPALEQIFLDALEEASDEIGFSVDWDTANAAASDWSRAYTYDLVKAINDTSRTMLQQAVSDFFDEGQTIDMLADKLAGIFGPVRAEMIAVTEVTRAVSQGEQLLVRELEKQGATMVAIWNTANDERVCPICVPRDQMKQGDGWTELPPAHVRCRCWTRYEPAP